MVNVGTSAQLSVVRPASLSMDISSVSSLLEVPYFGRKNLIVAAALTGGNVIVKLVEFLRGALSSLGVSEEQVADSRIYSVIVSSAQEKMDSTLQICPVLLGERHCPSDRASITNLSSDNFTLGDVASALMKGVAENVFSMMPAEVLEAGKVWVIVDIKPSVTLLTSPVLPICSRYNDCWQVDHLSAGTRS